MRETDAGLYVAGQLDLEDSEVAREAWRSMKRNRVALSFGYLATKQNKRADGVNELLELDLFEVSVVAAPANPDTRFLSLKSMNDGLTERQRQEIKRRSEQIGGLFAHNPATKSLPTRIASFDA